MSCRRFSIFVLSTALASVGSAWAQPPVVDGPTAGEGAGEGDPGDDAPQAVEVDAIDVVGERERATGVHRLTAGDSEAAGAERALRDSAFVTVVRVDERAGETTSVAEVLADTMGVTVRSLGGLNSFTSLSVRGGQSGYTTLSIDGIPLSRVASTTADIGRLTLASFAEVQLYRGAVPVGLGATALGGALDLTTALGRQGSDKPLTVSLGGGSFGTRHLRARLVGTAGTTDYHLGASYRGTNGDFSYYDDKGTNLLLTDDEMVVRQNNQDDQVELVGRLRHDAGLWSLTGGSRSFWRKQGIPGLGSVQSISAGATTVGQILDARLGKANLWGSSRLHGQLSAFGSLEWQHYQDQMGEVRLGVQDSRQWWLSTGLTGRLTIDAGDSHLLSLGLDSRFELAAHSDALETGDARGRGWRAGGAVSVADEISLLDERIALAPAMRLDWLHTVPIGDANQPVVGDGELMPHDQVFFSPRASARVRLWSGVALKSSLGYYMREPTVPELFGGRGVQVGNPTLVAEHGLSGDFGLVLAPARALGPLDRIYVEGVGFARRPHDTIIYRTTLGGSFNQGDTAMRGLEVAVAGRLARTVSVRANYTLLRTRQDNTLPSYEGKPLPNAPAHRLYARADVARQIRGRLAVVWADIAYTSANYLDLAGLSEVPARRFIGAGVKLEPTADLLLGIEVKNLLDERIQYVEYDPPPSPELARVPRALADFFGYPLPGRALYLSVEWKR